jgi:hypothetical protein
MRYSGKVFGALLCLLVGGIGCQNEQEGSNGKRLVEFSPSARSDHEHMHQLIASRGGGTLKLDLSDEVQYRFLRARLAASGKTPERSPQFFAMLENLRARHQEQGSRVSALAEAPPLDHLIGDFVVLPGGTTFEATAFATIQGGADYNFVDVVVWNEDQTQQLSDYGWGEVYGDGRKLKARARGPRPFVGDDVFIIDSVNLISSAGVDEVYMTSERVRPPPGGLVLHPRDTNQDGIVTLCLDRDYGDCDYPLVGVQQVQLPLKGNITFPSKVLQILNTGKTYVKLVEESGGPREMTFGPFINWLKINPNDPHQVLWDVPRNQGVFNGILFQRYEDVDFFLSIEVKLDRPGPAVTHVSKISSIGSGTTPGMPSMPKHQIVYSCLARGTQILMADGKTVSIEKIARGSKVVADDSGVALSVTDVSVGIERIPMVRIQDDAGHEILMTTSHPVLTPDRGVVWAEELTVGSKVLTRSGPRTLVTVKRELYHDQVYNLKLDTSTLVRKTFPEGSSMYANGFLVGDLGLQKAYEFKNREDRTADVLRRLPSRWNKDYQNSLKVSAR